AADPRRLSRASEYRPGARWRRGSRSASDAWQDQPGLPRGQGRLRRVEQSAHGHSLPFAGGQARNPSRVPGSHRLDPQRGPGYRRDHGTAAPDPERRRRAVSPGVHPHRAGPRTVRQFLEADRRRALMDIKQALNRVVGQLDLTTEEMKAVMRQIMTGQCTDAQIGAFLMGMRMKSETIDEIVGAVEVMRELAEPVHFNSERLVDTCGTGGDGMNIFNVSTAASFVVAAAGGKVAKHGNRAVSGKSGSADLLEAAGVYLDLTPEQVARS